MDDNQCYHCFHCTRKSKSVRAHLFHLNHHRHITKYLICGLGRCKSSFKTESALRFHIIRNHRVYVAQTQHNLFKKSIVHNPSCKYNCPVSSCGQQFFHDRDFSMHLKDHFKSATSVVPCPSSDCLKQFKSYRSLTGHMSRKHRTQAPVTQDEALVLTPAEPPDLMEDAFLFSDVDVVASQDLMHEESLNSAQEDRTIALAQFFQKLEYKHMVSGVVTQAVYLEIKNLLMDYQRCFMDSLVSNMKSAQISEDLITEVVSLTSSCTDVMESCHLLRSIYIRKLFYKNNFCFVEPIEVPLKNGSFFYFVPVDKSLIAAFQNKSWRFCLKKPPFSQDGCCRDFFDGQAFKLNPFFKENPDAVPIIIYQDGFQVVCAIGPAKNLKHKILAVYMAFGNLPSEIRFKKDSIQLVALVRECDFNHEEIFGLVVEELKRLEEGTEIPGVGIVKAGIAFIAGDNLGSHGVGGFTENFSSSHYFCRHCLLTREKYNRPGGEVRLFRNRTKESHNRALQKVKIRKDGTIKSCQGVKFDSEFNKLQSFHVTTGLPFCIGHDLMEGLIAYDLKLYIQHFVELGWFDLLKLNELINNFPYSEEDRKDRPVPIKILDKKRLAGGAWQLWQMLRLFPLIIHGYIKDPTDEVWLSLLRLRKIVGMAIAPEIHESFHGEFQETANVYIIQRKALFPSVPLRCKHHYLLHEMENCFCFGPPIKTWTMRFESKHSFFNRSWKSSNNSINVLQTLSYKHEFLQSWVRSGGGVRCDVETSGRSPFVQALYSAAITNSLTKCASVLDECNYVIFKGTQYKKGHVVIVKRDSFCEKLEVGMIHLIILDSSDTVYFVVRKGTAILKPILGSYKLTLSDTFQCLQPSDLICFYPHSTYVRDTQQYICLRHALLGQPSDISV
ncbi:Transcription factor YY2 [Frankliniella fusca]|uniref:Transcription factor YY2 n=1 Tax=Frankliniella fusca TaxID=407009 RepID=A0AAE1HJW9_9NEOP|nr:Transcription factor YY2 [Frankliniella fusca]KAK3929221.1 Transcription factor YY2 [Frankliniella fusca]